VAGPEAQLVPPALPPTTTTEGPGGGDGTVVLDDDPDLPAVAGDLVVLGHDGDRDLDPIIGEIVDHGDELLPAGTPDRFPRHRDPRQHRVALLPLQPQTDQDGDGGQEHDDPDPDGDAALPGPARGGTAFHAIHRRDPDRLGPAIPCPDGRARWGRRQGVGSGLPTATVPGRPTPRG